MKYEELTPQAQATAVAEVNRLNPIQTRTSSLIDLVYMHKYNKDGEIVDDPNAGQDPEYYEDLLI